MVTHKNTYTHTDFTINTVDGFKIFTPTTRRQPSKMNSAPEKTVVRTTILPLKEGDKTKEITIDYKNITFIITAPEDSGALRVGNKIIVGEMHNVRTILLEDVERVACGELSEVPLGMYEMQSLRDVVAAFKK